MNTLKWRDVPVPALRLTTVLWRREWTHWAICPFLELWKRQHAKEYESLSRYKMMQCEFYKQEDTVFANVLFLWPSVTEEFLCLRNKLNRVRNCYNHKSHVISTTMSLQPLRSVHDAHIYKQLVKVLSQKTETQAGNCTVLCQTARSIYCNVVYHYLHIKWPDSLIIYAIPASYTAVTSP
jgi:hypothetical protein